MATTVLALGRGPAPVDPTWPPVLIAAVLAGVSAGVISIVMVLRRLRADVRGQRREGRS
jgi:hypothetical protein